MIELLLTAILLVLLFGRRFTLLLGSIGIFLLVLLVTVVPIMTKITQKPATYQQGARR
jgi:hypothetical protein